MKYFLLIGLAVILESIVFAQLHMAGLVFPATLLSLILVARSMKAEQLIMTAVAAGLALDVLRAGGYSPFWMLAGLIVALFIVVWRRYSREQINSRRYLIQMYAPLLALSAFIWAVVPAMGIASQINLERAVYEWLGYSLMLAVSLVFVRMVERQYGV